jgi:hypothetical protein
MRLLMLMYNCETQMVSATPFFYPTMNSSPSMAETS